ncbi:MAG: UDP-N-acetylmuramoyl-L-alanyl-D-glutamate--2,6-diaminopimelate ligase [Candidatus Promineofilum sp.]|nr:UDP-N-acetylmuramoyl-L-alanyl-D-glutamate--2,6-diaminopimelate ligase [Promineifilum sp.]
MSTSTRRLTHLLSAWRHAVQATAHPQPPAYDGPDVALTRFTEKTSEVEPGSAFVARVRAGSDGHPYIATAIERGASLILAQQPADALGLTVPPGVVYLTVPDTAEALAWLSAAWEGFPSRQLVVAGITGTDGKTTTANILFNVLREAGIRAGLLSTIRAVIGDEEEPLALHVTTPEAPVVQRYLRRMVDAGLTHCVLEATSHALAQHRVAAVDFDLAVITNITHEHLDYHGSYEAYFAAKRRLFGYLLDDLLHVPTHNRAKVDLRRTAVLNRDDRSFAPLADFLAGRPVDVLTYGLEATANDATATGIAYGPQETALTLHVGGASLPVRAPLPGAFNVHNMLAAAAAASALGVGPETIGRGLENVGYLSGRMERIELGQPFRVVVDFAHTPNALARAIDAARSMAAAGGRVIVVFGSAGKRDVAKRRLMAEVAARAADLTILTAEDPRSESLDDILAMMAAAATAAGGVEGQTFWRVPDRGRAIHFALSPARPGDVVLICGKGHEQSMCFGDVEYPWDDRAAARAALAAQQRGEAMADLGLPTY